MIQEMPANILSRIFASILLSQNIKAQDYNMADTIPAVLAHI